MNNLVPVFIFFAVGAVLAILITIYNRKTRKQRKLDMTLFAAKNKFTFHPEEESKLLLSLYESGDPNLVKGSDVGLDLCRMLADFEPFGQGYAKVVRNAVTGEVSFGTFYTFDYEYSDGPKDDSRQFKFGIVAFRVPYAFRKLKVRPEDIVDKVTGSIGFPDIQFESVEFNRKFNVGTDDKKFAFDLLHPQMMSYLIALPKLDWQFCGPYIVLTQWQEFWDVGVLRELIPTVDKFLELIPDYVKQDICFKPHWTSLFLE